jgi:putative SOS response-associated peptidase YedK
MCARFTVAKDLAEFAKSFNFVCRVAFFAPRYNFVPRQQAPVIVLNHFQPVLTLMRWGLIPSWATRLRPTSTWQEDENCEPW